jgi:SWI/SNF-related matrix-associated actin-dependent regulator 1 of chromatin subfamily A
VRLSWNGARFNLECTSSEWQVAKKQGFHWDWRARVGWTGLSEVARKFEQFADDKAKKKLNVEAQNIALSKATTSNIVIPAPEGLEYLPFQKAGIEYELSRKYVLNADSMGLGKSIQAIGLCNADPSIKKILVVCPASLTINWSREIQKWMMSKLTGDFANSKTLPNSDIVIANYEIMHKLKSKIMEREWDLHIYDESHYCKNPESQRTKAILGHESERNCFALEAKRKLFLTGTPILNRPVELWPMLRVIDPEGLGSNFWLFAKKFCDATESGPFGRDFSGASNLDILQNRLRNACMIRRTKEEVMKELPPKRRQIITIPLPPAAEKVVQKELDFYTNNEAAIEKAIENAAIAQAAGDVESYNAAAKDLRGLRQVAFEELAKLRHDTAVAKVPYVISFLENALEQENKIVLFAHHQDVLVPIFEKFKSVAVKLDGTMSIEQKQLSVDRFQTDPKVKLFCGSITAAGVGITLTESSYAIFCESSWVPAHMTQAEDRLHRIGQKDAVWIGHLVFDRSLDCNMIKKIVKKQEIIDKALG